MRLNAYIADRTAARETILARITATLRAAVDPATAGDPAYSRPVVDRLVQEAEAAGATHAEILGAVSVAVAD